MGILVDMRTCEILDAAACHHDKVLVSRPDLSNCIEGFQVRQSTPHDLIRIAGRLTIDPTETG